MRALNSRRPQLTSTLCLLLLLFVVHGGRARSVPRDEEGLVQPEGKLSATENQPDVRLTLENSEEASVPGQVREKLLASRNDGAEDEKVQSEKPRAVEGKISQPKTGDEVEEDAKGDAERLVDRPPSKDASLLLQELRSEKKEAKKIDALEKPLVGDFENRIGTEGSRALNQQDDEVSVAKKRRRNDVSLVDKTLVHEIAGIPVEQPEGSKDEGIRRFDARVDAEDVAPSRENADKVGDNVDKVEVSAADIAAAAVKPYIKFRRAEEEEPKTAIAEQEDSVKAIEESYMRYVEEPKEEIPIYFRKSIALDNGDRSKNDEEGDSDEGSGTEEGESIRNREYRYLVDSSSKSTRKNSTVYLNAEEKMPDREQQSIVDGQIKKLISIRDGALDAQKADKLDETNVLSSKGEAGEQEVPFVQESAQSERKSKDGKEKTGRAQNLHRVRIITPESLVYNILQDALESYPSDEPLVSYVDPNNETLKELLTTNQLSILQMAEKFLPQALRSEYSDRMFSCVRRFEYFSCVKYFAWPMIKQYFPALPAFPDYQNWYPIIDWFPQYPILPFPSLTGDVGELPEVVDADATRTRRPRPEAIIIQVLQNTLKEQPRISTAPSFLDRSTDSYVALIPQDQLLAFNMAEQLIPVSLRPEFIQKTVRCMKEFTYLTCIKYSTWPTVKQYIPELPDISGLLFDFQIPQLPDIFDYIPQLPTLPDLGSYWPIGDASDQKSAGPPAYIVLKSRPEGLRSSNEVETKILEILTKMRNSLEKFQETSPFLLTGNSIAFSSFSKRQLDILRLAECLVPPALRLSLITEVLVYLQENDNFIDSARYIIWPTIARYVPTLPEFPTSDYSGESIESASSQKPLETKEYEPEEKIEERVNPTTDNDKIPSSSVRDKESRNKVQENVPVISVTGTRFVPIFTELPETVILNILRGVQLQSFNLNRGTIVPGTKNQQFLDLITAQQLNIVNLVDSLLPQGIRTEFTNRLLECLRVNNFLLCTRDVTWPTLMQYFPWLPNFPNFGIISNSPSNDTSPTSTQPPLTEQNTDSRNSQPLAETDVKTGQHGDTTVTITDTRFFPIFNELPESVILNILKTVQLSVPNLSASPVPARIHEFSNYLTEQQINIVQIAENLLPVSTRLNFISRISSCLGEKSFLECTRDITWPTIAQSFPWLPSFPNFGSLQNLPRIRFQVFLAEKSPASGLDAQPPRDSTSQKASGLLLREAEEKIENILTNTLGKPSQKLERSYLDSSRPDLSHLTKRQEYIIRLVENGIPEPARASYVSRMLECTKFRIFIVCTQTISWPTLKLYVPSLPDFPDFNNWLSQIPEDGQVILDPTDAGSDFSSDIQINPGISQLPGGFPPISQLPTFPQYPWHSRQRISVAQTLSRSGIQGTSTITPSVGSERAVPEYAGQPPRILVDVSKEKAQLRDEIQPRANTEDPSSPRANNRTRRSIDLLDTTYETDEAFNSSSSSPKTFPNITESRYLQLLIKIKQIKLGSKTSLRSNQYFVDTLNSTIRDTLTADQYEILKLAEDLDASNRGVAQQVVQCIQSLSFIRCMGIFIWPLITNNLPSLLGLPSLGIFGRSFDMENKVQEYFGMSASKFESELLGRKESIEHSFLDWYNKLIENEFQTNFGSLKIRGYGNGELGISFSSSREGRAAKLKDNKNLPSILTIISDIMEEVLDQRPEGEKTKKEKEKKERSIDGSRESDIQFLKDSEEYVDIKRSMNDDEIITMFLDKIKSNDSDADNDNLKYLDMEDAYDAFGVLFGTRLHSRLADKLQNFDHQPRFLGESNSDEETKEVSIVPLESRESASESKVLPSKDDVTYSLEKDSSTEQEDGQKQRQKRAKSYFKSLLEKHGDKYLKDLDAKGFVDIEENKIIEEQAEKNKMSGLIIKLPRLDDKITLKKMTGTLVHVGKSMKTKMMQMMPGFGLVLSFLIQMVLAHARAAASMAGIVSNMAIGSAMIGMIRENFFGSSSHPHIKHVYDNDKVGPGITWPSYGPDFH